MMYKAVSIFFGLLIVWLTGCMVSKPKEPVGHNPEFAAMILLSDQLIGSVIADAYQLTADTAMNTELNKLEPVALYNVKTTFSKQSREMILHLDSMHIHTDSVRIPGGTLRLLNSNWKPTGQLDSSTVVVELKSVSRFKDSTATQCSRLVYNYLNKKFILESAEKVPCKE